MWRKFATRAWLLNKLRLFGDFKEGRSPDRRTRDRRSLLRAAFGKQSIEQQQDHGADDRHNPAGDIITARKDATDPRANQRAGDAEQNRDDATTGIFSRHQQLCDRTDNKTNEDGPND